MLPDLNLLKNSKQPPNVNLTELLKIINARIEKLLDKDHLIGHSYFLNITELDELKNVFKNKIIPLLQEYFFGDYGKIGLVLGEGFFEKEGIKDDSPFAKFRDYDVSELNEKPIYRIKDLNQADDILIAIKFGFPKSIIQENEKTSAQENTEGNAQ
jgi:5-methylcytosine-specific restriction protein B